MRARDMARAHQSFKMPMRVTLQHANAGHDFSAPIQPLHQCLLLQRSKATTLTPRAGRRMSRHVFCPRASQARPDPAALSPPAESTA